MAGATWMGAGMAENRKTSYGRPIVPLDPTPVDGLLLLGTLAGVAVGVVVLIAAWPQLPERIPTHFGVTGAPNAYGGKGILILLPALSAVLGLGLWVLSRFPQVFNYPRRITDENAPRQYRLAQRLLRVLAFGIVSILAYVEWQTIQVGLGRAAGFNGWFLVAFVAALLAAVVIYLVLALRAA